MKKFFVIEILSLLLISQTSFSQVLIGRITNKKKEPLPFANIYCRDINIGTTSNLNGEFIFKLPKGERKIIISYIGYKSDTVSVKLAQDEKIKIEIVLKETVKEMPTIYVFDSKYNEAERIILNVILGKYDYLDKIKNYHYIAYDKTILSMNVKDTVRIGGILESQSKAFFESPDKFNQIILSKRQTKNFSPVITNFFTMGKIPNLLDEEISLDELSIISPLNSKTFDYYSFVMKDTSYYNGQRIFVLAFEPKNKIIPLFTGEIGIIDEIFLPLYVNLYGKNNVITSLRSQIEIEAKYAEFNNEFLMPVFINEKYIFNFSFPGLPPIIGTHTCLISEYGINDTAFSFQFTKNIQTEKLLPESESKILWENNQLIALTSEEKKAFSKIDSLMENMSFLKKSIFWLTQNNFGSLSDLPITSFNDFYHFNRVEGHYAGVGIKLNNLFEGINLLGGFGYGFSDKKTKFSIDVSYSYKPVIIRLALFENLRKQNKFYDYEDFDITIQSWFEKNDFADYYYSKGINGEIVFQLHDNISTSFGFEKRKDTDAQLNSRWSLFNKTAKYNPVKKIDKGYISEYTFKLSYDNKMYYDLGFFKIADKSKSYLEAELQVSKGFFSANIKDSYLQTHLKINIYHQSSSCLNPSLLIRGGFNSGIMLKQNLFHLPGNFGTFSSPKLFNALMSDDYTGNKYFTVFLENNFSNIIYKFIGLPYLKDTKFDFLIFGKYGWINEEPLIHSSKSLWETGFGIGNILALLRVDFCWRIQPYYRNDFKVILSTMFGQ